MSGGPALTVKLEDLQWMPTNTKPAPDSAPFTLGSGLPPPWQRIPALSGPDVSHQDIRKHVQDKLCSGKQTHTTTTTTAAHPALDTKCLPERDYRNKNKKWRPARGIASPALSQLRARLHIKALDEVTHVSEDFQDDTEQAEAIEPRVQGSGGRLYPARNQGRAPHRLDLYINLKNGPH
ncbi:hypothetical protein N1851_034658 [Merluccius polli]|uniref:Uncharacterized protein n=1 Tax=Merluccius polli TaxID=89951 RepID=A0AA47LZ82_MERPO|nr:hypothetical protein N1851_034658 [Merluccius polli]